MPHKCPKTSRHGVYLGLGGVFQLGFQRVEPSDDPGLRPLDEGPVVALNQADGTLTTARAALRMRAPSGVPEPQGALSVANVRRRVVSADCLPQERLLLSETRRGPALWPALSLNRWLEFPGRLPYIIPPMSPMPPMAAHAGSGLFGWLGDDRLGHEDVLRDRRGVLQRRARDHGRVDDPRLH